MRISNPGIFMPLFFTFFLIIITWFFTPDTPLWLFTRFTLIASMAIYLSTCFLKSANKNLAHLTLTGDAFVAGGLFMVAAFADSEHLQLCMILICVPLADMMRYVCREDPPKRYYPIDHRNTWIVYTEIALTVLTYTVIVICNFRYPSLLDVVFLSLAAVAFLIGFYLMTSEEALMPEEREKYLPMTFLAVPLALCSPYIYRSVGKASFVYCIALALVIVVILTLDTMRFAARDR